MSTATVSTGNVDNLSVLDNEDDGIMLPPLLLREPSLPAAPPFTLPQIRKRPFLRSREPSSYEEQLADAINTSSDPALFSSDETPDAEDYSSGMKRRKKRTYKGTWWGDNLEKAQMGRRQSLRDSTKKRRFRRNFDSGIFMADESSATDLSSDSLLDQELLRTQEKGNAGEHASKSKNAQMDPTSERQVKLHRSFKFTTEAALKRMSGGRPINPKDHLVRTVVQTCLDNNNENVDWSGMGLDSLPPAITDLKSMIKRIGPATVVEDKLAPFEAHLNVYLANNDFSVFPPSVFELTNIQLLSVRRNKLSEIPPAISSLVNLKELNVSSNNLIYLPYELLQLVIHQSLNTIRHPLNAWMAIPDAENQFANTPIMGFVNANKTLLHRIAVSKPLDFLPNGATQRQTSTITAHRTSKAPHLTEMILRALLRHNTSKADLSSHLLDEDHPPAARKLLDLLHSTQQSGGRTCTFCDRTIVLPRYTWFEWWDIQADHNGGNMSCTEFTGNPGPAEKCYTTKLAIFENCKVDSPHRTYYCIDQHTEIPEHVKERILPFQRMACGCVDVRTGLEMEVNWQRTHNLPRAFGDVEKLGFS